MKRVLCRYFPLIAFVMCAACASISYDQQADRQISALIQKTDQQMIIWEHKAEAAGKSVKYEAEFYDQIAPQIITLQIRMESSPNIATPKLSGIFASLSAQFDAMRALHKKQGYLAAHYLHSERLLINAQLTALVTYELSLKGQ